MEEINIKDFFEYIRKYILLIAGFVSVAIIAVCIYNVKIKVPLYTTYTTVILANSQVNDSTITQNDITLNQHLVSTYSEIIKSKLVLEQVISETGIDYDVDALSKNVSVSTTGNTEMLKISVTDPDPKLAAKIANSIAEVFGSEVSKIYKLNNVSVIDMAKEPDSISNNTLIRDIGISFAIALILSLGIIFVIYYFDDTIKLSDSLEENLKMPVIGKIINNGPYKKHVKVEELMVNKYPKSLVSEGFKTLRTNLQFSSVDNDVKSILITSSIPGEGKSFISANLAIAFCQTGKNVLLVDCDMRKGRQHKIFNVSNDKGLSNLLIDTTLKNHMSYLKKTGVKNLFLLTRGTVPPNPSELLNSNKNKDLIRILTTKFDIVIFDGVPCNGLPDSVIMSTLVDKTLIVCSENVTPKSVLENTKKTLANVNADVSGIVLNKINKKSNGYYVKYYSYYGNEK